MTKSLTLRQDRFLDGLLDPRTKTQKQAALEAGYSPKSVDAIACEILKNPKVLAALDRKREALLDKASDHQSTIEFAARMQRRAMRFFERELNDMESGEKPLDVVLVGNLSRLLHDIQTGLIKVQSLLPEPDTAHETAAGLLALAGVVKRAFTVGVRLAGRYGPLRALEFSESIAGRVERWESIRLSKSWARN